MQTQRTIPRTVFALLLAAATGGVLLAPGHLEAQNLRSSRWDTVYSAPDGTLVRARLTLNGNHGQYVTKAGAKGSLSNLRYGSTRDKIDGNVPVISGDWRFQNGAEGTLTLYPRKDGQSFAGVWSSAKGDFAWIGIDPNSRDKAPFEMAIAPPGSVAGVSMLFRLPDGRKLAIKTDRQKRLLGLEIKSQNEQP